MTSSNLWALYVYYTLAASKFTSEAKNNPNAYLVSSLGYLISILNNIKSEQLLFLPEAYFIHYLLDLLSQPSSLFIIFISGWTTFYSLNIPNMFLLPA